MRARKSQQQIRRSGLSSLWFDQGSPVRRKLAAKQMSDVEQRGASANQASVMRTVTDNIALGAQDRILKSNSIQRSTYFGEIVRILFVHHRTSHNPCRNCNDFRCDA